MSTEQTAIDQADFDEMSMIAEQHTKKEDNVTCSDVRELEEARARIVELEAHCERLQNAFVKWNETDGGGINGANADQALVEAFEQLPQQSLVEIQAKANKGNQEKTKCNYPECKCPFDMGSDNKCLLGLDNK